jgi:hypothetical protein
MSRTLEELFQALSPEQREQVRCYAESLVQTPQRRGKPRFTWAGAVQDLRGQYTSVELQHQISRWRSGSE